MDYGKKIFEDKKKSKSTKPKSMKEIKFRPSTDTGDIKIKSKNIIKFLGEGRKVKVSIKFRGREMQHQNLALELIEKIIIEVGESGKIESTPRLEGRSMFAIFS